mmetsp:Transcript_19890/g.24553  ORF Transcript_19890/g.24553 Transcript_19890/m.24553 type:complete len:415 (+) Transcript_19890:420-1664(+)|eukprot:CAMPEP_0172511202 /NCGR_PEP_ID=MMETSP1066-20121228/234615_1 /TAXON_ID=671091 /ORGANISM="Coscinodiscus wailesii, Strain CCMP2513" /LENGTH=414 /DNA_ID=CAMNT_0013290489 /DNA_START=378 /DNA_END=1625 /DNA_ORIENTATION=-
MEEPQPHALYHFTEIEQAGPPARPLEFPPPIVHRGNRVAALVVVPETGARQVLRGVIHRETSPDTTGGTSTSSTGPSVAYWPQKQLQEAIYGSVWACLVLRRHHGPAAEEAARAAGVDPCSVAAPIVWEVTNSHVAIKMMVWARIHRMRGRQLEDPVKEIACMQLLGSEHPHVLRVMEVLQDDDFLYSVMPYCSGGDLFGLVVEYAEDEGREGGMSEPMARYWFRQILSGLHYLQSRGICHRDLSLENILVDHENSLIIDMGMCLRVPYNSSSSSTSTTDVSNGTVRRLMRHQGTCGKHNYMSPEIFKNTEPFDGFGIDLWAAGVILYIMLTGFPPYDQPCLADQRFELIVNGRLHEQLQVWEVHVSDEAGDLMQSMLQLDPRQRLTLGEVMKHKWVRNEDVQPPPREEFDNYH